VSAGTAIDLPVEAVRLRQRALIGVALAALVVGSTGIRVLLATFMRAPWIVPDEIVYSELAKSIAGMHAPAIRGVVTFAFGPIYPILIAPAWIAGDDPARAYRLALCINSFVMSLAAIPAYALARMMVARSTALLVAVFSVGLPSMAYTTVLMTENAYYPAFLLALVCVARVLQKPDWQRQALALASIGLLTMVRVQGVSLIFVYVGAAVLYEYLGRDKSRLRAYMPSAIVIAVVALCGPIFSLLRSEGILGWLGAYAGAFSGIHIIEIPKWLIYEVADLTLYVALCPAAATVLLLARARRGVVESEPLRLFISLALPTLASLLILVACVSASVDVDGEEVINERYLFYVVPLLLIGLAVWIEQGMQRSIRIALPVTAGLAMLPLIVPINDYSYNAIFQTLAVVPWVVLEMSDHALLVPLGLFLSGLTGLFMCVSRQRAARLWMSTGTAFVIVGTAAVVAGFAASDSSRRLGVGNSADWIDSAVPASSDVTAIALPGSTDYRLRRFENRMVTINEFFNRSVGKVIDVGGASSPGWLPTVEARVNPSGMLVEPNGRPIHAGYVLASCRLRIRGRIVARDASTGATLVRVAGTVRLDAAPRDCFGLYGERYLAKRQ